MDSRDRYRIVGELGRGGVAEVFEAIAFGEHGFERRVAIKKLRAELADEDTLVRSFIDEARIASRLHHVNIVSIFDFGIMDNVPFQVIELVEGLDGRKLLDQVAVPLEVALYIALQVAQALAHAHEATAVDGSPLGIVHRDVKPRNVLISWSGDVKLADFGIAFAKKRLQMTVAGSAKGTLRFMSPEQAIGGAVDRRTDVFALGCLLHALISGDSPVGEDMRVVISAKVPEDVRAIVEKATRHARQERYDDVEQVAVELGRALARRAAGDPRAALKLLLDGLRPKKAAVRPAVAMLDVALLLGDAPVRRFSTVAAPPVSEVQDEPTRATVIEPRRPVLKNSMGWVRIAAWMTLVVIGVANLVVMLSSRQEVIVVPAVESAPPIVEVARPVVQPREVPLPSPSVVEEKRKIQRRSRSEPSVAVSATPVFATPSREELRARLARVRDRLRQVGAAELEDAFLELSTKEARARDEDELRAIDGELRALEAKIAAR